MEEQTACSPWPYAPESSCFRPDEHSLPSITDRLVFSSGTACLWGEPFAEKPAKVQTGASESQGEITRLLPLS